MSSYCDCTNEQVSEDEYDWGGGQCIERKKNNFELCGFILAEYVCFLTSLLTSISQPACFTVCSVAVIFADTHFSD